jgi:hypothetical protein
VVKNDTLVQFPFGQVESWRVCPYLTKAPFTSPYADCWPSTIARAAVRMPDAASLYALSTSAPSLGRGVSETTS